MQKTVEKIKRGSSCKSFEQVPRCSRHSNNVASSSGSRWSSGSQDGKLNPNTESLEVPLTQSPSSTENLQGKTLGCQLLLITAPGSKCNIYLSQYNSGTIINLYIPWGLLVIIEFYLYVSLHTSIYSRELEAIVLKMLLS